jgi:ribonuclease HI
MWSHCEYQICRIYIDNQAAIKAIDNPRRQSSQTIIKDILDSIDAITSERTHPQIEIKWIQDHAEIGGNEQADTEAKKAAMDPTLKLPHNHKALKSARARYIKTEAKKQWQTIWNNNTKVATALQPVMRGK